MRFTSVIASVAAIKLSDAPDYFDEPTWNERMPSASVFLQVSACNKANAEGVSCIPDESMLGFVTAGDGANLGPGKFDGTTFQHLEVATAAADLPICTGTNGPVGVNCQRETCTGTNGPMDGPASSGCIRAEPADIPHYNEDETAGRPY